MKKNSKDVQFLLKIILCWKLDCVQLILKLLLKFNCEIKFGASSKNWSLYQHMPKNLLKNYIKARKKTLHFKSKNPVTLKGKKIYNMFWLVEKLLSLLRNFYFKLSTA